MTTYPNLPVLYLLLILPEAYIPLLMNDFLLRLFAVMCIQSSVGLHHPHAFFVDAKGIRMTVVVFAAMRMAVVMRGLLLYPKGE